MINYIEQGQKEQPETPIGDKRRFLRSLLGRGGSARTPDKGKKKAKEELVLAQKASR